MSIICAIHQPNFFPWIGYFDKIKRADIFVFLDDIQNQKTGGSWINRVKFNCHGEEKWVTCPIKRPSGTVLINQVEFSDSLWREKFLEILRNYYRKHPNYKFCHNLISSLIYGKNYICISDLNKDVIINISSFLGHQTQFISKSSLNINSHATQMLIDICQEVGANTYLCGGGASGYQEDTAFSKAGLNLRYQNFIATPYPSFTKFVPGLSIIDFLMNTPHDFLG